MCSFRKALDLAEEDSSDADNVGMAGSESIEPKQL